MTKSCKIGIVDKCCAGKGVGEYKTERSEAALIGIICEKTIKLKKLVLLLILIPLSGCVAPTVVDIYHDPDMDFAAVRSVAVLPFADHSGRRMAAERVRDVFINLLLATESVYVVPVGEVARGVSRLRFEEPTTPSPEEVVKLAGVIKVDAVFTGVVREYGAVRSGNASANLISFSMQMIETQTGRVVWSASATRGGIGITDRLFGGGGKPMNDITEEAVNEVLDKLFSE